MKRVLSPIIVLSLLYVLLGNARSVQENPFIPGAVIAVNMFVIVFAGLFFGKKAGLLVGIIGTFLNAISPGGSTFEFVAIIPHAIMGYAAGAIKGKGPTPILALTLLIGHVLNIIGFTLFGLLPASALGNPSLWLGIIYETIIGIIAITLLIAIARLVLEDVADNK